ncbi:Transcriptional regulator, AraC family (fragment) [Methylocella tundrae]|uniref:Transcriptional regulator, AraC family n=1 Tax=Methylocella tundrae TaxID=227605 RepID=A0A8B6M8Z0_METTU
MTIYLLTLDGLFDTRLATLLDASAAANELAESTSMATPQFTVMIVGVRRHVKTVQGLTVPVARRKGLARPDIVIVPALEGQSGRKRCG